MGEEILEIVDKAGEVIGRASRAVIHGDNSLLHRVVHVIVVNSSGDAGGDNFSKLTTFAIFRDDGNVALGKMIMEKTVQSMSKAMAEL